MVIAIFMLQSKELLVKHTYTNQKVFLSFVKVIQLDKACRTLMKQDIFVQPTISATGPLTNGYRYLYSRILTAQQRSVMNKE